MNGHNPDILERRKEINAAYARQAEVPKEVEEVRLKGQKLQVRVDGKWKSLMVNANANFPAISVKVQKDMVFIPRQMCDVRVSFYWV